MGHLNALDSSYYRPSIEQLAQEYVKFQNALFIDPSLSLKTEKEEIIQEARTAITTEGSRVQVLESKVLELTSALDRYEKILKEIKEEREKEKKT